MKKIVKWIVAMLLPLTSTGVLAAGFEEGTQYTKLANPQQTATADKIEVVELFWYGCPHCYKLEPYLQRWDGKEADDVEFIRLPAILGAGWELLAKAYFTADLLDATDKVHPALFHAIHEKKYRLNNVDKVRRIFTDNGVSGEDFNKTFKSFAVAMKLNNARIMTRRYAITGVPTLIVNGKYSTSVSKAGGNGKLIKVVDYLVEQERTLAATSEKAVMSEAVE